MAITRESAIDKEYLIKQTNSLLFDQIERMRGFKSTYISELILIEAKKNKKIEDELRYILSEGFVYNGKHYSRFGKSASQGKAGITAFVVDDIFEELYKITQMDIPVDRCVISKYEAQRCLTFSSCTLIENYCPNIVIVDEYEKVIPNQFIKYVVEKERTYTNATTGETGTYNSREIEEGYRDITISCFDGCGCHEKEFMETVSQRIGLEYNAVGSQIRMPFVKGYSVYVPFREIFREWGIETITDIYGKKHNVDEIDCIWNTSMFKAHKLFMQFYGNNAWEKYLETFHKYQYKLGISKYSHHMRHINGKSRMNFQYLQCLDLWNPKYIEWFNDKTYPKYDILAPENEGNIIKIAKYTTNLFEQIIKGNKFYTYKFMGIKNDSLYEADSIYMRAALVNDVMLKDPAVKRFVYRKLKKAIDEAKIGKIYVSGFYHTLVGDMIGYLQYVAGLPVVGCLKERQFYCSTMKEGRVLGFRSPLVDASEVNEVYIVSNDITRKWLSHFKDQDIVMTNMYDISAPQMGGCDYDGDILMLTDDPILLASKIDKPIVIDINDKATTVEKDYNKQNIIEYEMLTRDNRIGEITNIATVIENRYTTNEDIKKKYSDQSSLLRIFQGREIDFIKTGLRWQIPARMKRETKKLPWFLLYNYPAKKKRYDKIHSINKGIEEKADRLELNAFRSPSPMNELCDYLCTWEKKKLIWDNSCVDTRCLIINNNLKLDDKTIIRKIRHLINDFAKELQQISYKQNNLKDSDYDETTMLLGKYHSKLKCVLYDEELLANYTIKVAYSNTSTNKTLAWYLFGEWIIKNLQENSNPKKNIEIVEAPYETKQTYEYLGKYYELKGCNNV